eukprot:gene13254-19092_t
MTKQSLGDIDALLGCAIGMPPISIFGPDGCAGVSVLNLPQIRTRQILEALQHAINWTREVVNSFSTQLRTPNNDECKKKLIVRCSQLFQLETVFTGLLSSWEHSAAALQALPSLALSSMKSSTGRDALGSPPAAASVSPMPLPWEQKPSVEFAELSAATYLAARLQSKLASVIAARRGSVFGPSAAEPALRCILDAAVGLSNGTVTIATSPWDENSEAAGDKADLFSALYLARPASQTDAIVHKYISTVIAIFQSVVSNTADHPPGFMETLLGQFSASAQTPVSPNKPSGSKTPQKGTNSITMDSFKATFRYLSTLSTLSTEREAQPSFSLDMLLLSALQALVSAAEANLASLAAEPATPLEAVAAAKLVVTSLHKRLSRSAGVMLESDWGRCVGEVEDGGEQTNKRLSRTVGVMLESDWGRCVGEVEGGGTGDAKLFTWKGQGSAIAELLQVYISHSPSPTDTLLRLSTVVLHEVPRKVPSKQTLVPVAGYASLCDATFCSWFNSVMASLQLCWKSVCSKVQKVLKAKGQLNDEEELELVNSSLSCAASFAGLLSLSRVHGHRAVILSTSVKHGSLFVDTLLDVLPVWKSVYSRHQVEFANLIKDVQRGTKVMQTLCAEGKARSAVSLTSKGKESSADQCTEGKVPAAKRSIERFIFQIKCFLHDTGKQGTFWMGNLKHRDLNGNTVASQYPRGNDESEEEEEEEEGQEDGEGEEGRAEDTRGDEDGGEAEEEEEEGGGGGIALLEDE